MVTWNFMVMEFLWSHQNTLNQQVSIKTHRYLSGFKFFANIKIMIHREKFFLLSASFV